MLQAIRSKAGSLVVKILFLALILSFGAWGIGDIFRQRSAAETTVATVGDRKIQADQLQDVLRRKIEQARGMFGPDFGPEQAKQLGLVNTALDGLIDEDLLDLEEARLGISVDDKVVSGAILATPQFHDAQGNFDRTLFNNVLASNHLTEARYAAFVRHDIARTQLASAITAGSIAPSVLAEQLYRSRKEKRSVDTIFIASAAMAGIAQPSDAELQDYYAKHEDLFRAPEYRNVTALVLTQDDVLDRTQISDTKLHDEYDARIAEFSTPERHKLEQIVLPDEGKARDAAAQLRAGKSFEAVAKDVADQSGDSIELGWVTQQDMPAEVADPAFALKPGETSDPVQSPLGWHIFKSTGTEEAHVKPFDEARQALTAELARDMAPDELFSIGNQIQDSLAGGASVEQAADQFKLKTVNLPAIDPDGKDPSGKAVDLALADDVLRAAFDTEKGQTTRLLEAKTGGYFVLRVDNVTPAAVKPLADIKDEVKQHFLADKRDAAAEAHAKEIQGGVAQGKTLAQLAAPEQLKIDTTTGLGRTGDGKLPTPLVSRIFKLKPGEIAVESSAGGGEGSPSGWYVAQLKSVESPDPADDKPALANLAKELGDSIGGDLLAELQRSLRDRFTVDIKTDRLDKVL